VNIDYRVSGSRHCALVDMEHALRLEFGERERRRLLSARQSGRRQTGEPSPSREGGHQL
jgi:hypothetical protein